MARPDRTAYRAAAASLALLLGACGAQGDDADPTTTGPAATAPAPTPDPSPTPTDGDQTADPTTIEDGSTMTPEPIQPDPPASDALPTGPVPDSVLERPDVQEAIAAEAERRGVSEDQVAVAGFRDVTWNDGSIGCPQDGMMYTQALVPGYQLVLEVDGQKASYHSARDKEFSYCANPVPPLPGGSGPAPTDM